MSGPGPRWIRHRPDRMESMAALGAGLGVGLVVGTVVVYLARLFIAREQIDDAPLRALATVRGGSEEAR